MNITFRITDIGDFSDGSLLVNKEIRRYDNAAVIEFKSPEDAQAFAKFMKYGFQMFRVEVHV